MRIYNRYVLSLILSSFVINTGLALWNRTDIEIYFVINIFAYLVITLLYVYFNPGARKALNTISFVLFGGFLLVAAMKVMEIISAK